MVLKSLAWEKKFVMLKRLRFLLTIGPFADIDAQTPDTVQVIETLFSLLLLGLVATGILTLLASSNPLTALILHALAALILVMLLMLLHRGYVLTTARVFVVSFWLMLTIINVGMGGINSPGISGYHALIVLAGILLGLRAALAVSASSIATLVLLHLASTQNLIAAAVPPVTSFSRTAVMMSITVLLTIGLLVTVRVVKDSVAQVNGKRSELENALNQLGQTTVSRDFVDNIVRSMSNLLIVLERDNTIRMVNQATCDILGYSETELVGSLFDNICEGYSLARIQNLATIDEEATSEHEITFRTRAGVLLPFAFTRSALRDGYGRVTGIVCIAQDITERKRMEQERETNAMRYRALFEQSYDGIVLLNTFGKPLAFNERASVLLGYSKEELRDLNYRDIFIAQPITEGHERNEETLWRVKAGVIPSTYERQLRRKDGSEFTAEVRLQMVQESDGSPMYIQCIIRDITARKLAEMEIARLYEIAQSQLRDLRELYTKVSGLERFQSLMMNLAKHDLRSTLASVEMHLKPITLQENRVLTADHMATLQDVFAMLARARHLLDELLTPNGIEVAPEATALDLSALTRQVVVQNAVYAVRKSQELATDISIQPVSVCGNKIQLLEAIFNLVENAIKYSPDEEYIQVRVRQENNEAILEVQDCGPGIPLHMHSEIFKPFVRVMTPQTEHISGTGMGLNLVQTIVARHNGRIIFRSIPGEGSLFGFALPLTENCADNDKGSAASNVASV